MAVATLLAYVTGVLGIDLVAGYREYSIKTPPPRLCWVAAGPTGVPGIEMRLIILLVGAMGVKPSEGFIMDKALWNHLEYTKAGFHDNAAYATAFGEEPPTDLVVDWEICREMSFRIAWKPYMYSQTLPHLLGAVSAPTLVVWGDDDKIVPRSAGDIYVEQLPNARFEIIKACGHFADLEKPAELASLVTEFVAG